MDIQWKDKYATGNEKIDEQHRQFFHLMNEVQEKSEILSKGMVLPRMKLQAAVENFIDFAIEHFEEEETILIKCGCLKCKEHILKHKAYKQILSDCQEKMKKIKNTEDINWFGDMCNFIQKYFVEHIQKGHEDGYLDCIKKER
jgi:hemerythrin